MRGSGGPNPTVEVEVEVEKTIDTCGPAVHRTIKEIGVDNVDGS